MKLLCWLGGSCATGIGVDDGGATREWFLGYLVWFGEGWWQVFIGMGWGECEGQTLESEENHVCLET